MRASLIAILPLLACSCLAADDRPPPGSVLLTLSSTDAVTQGFTTEDGWSVALSRVLASVGAAGFGAEETDKNCSPYSSSFYWRVFNLQAGNGQKVSEHFARGACEFHYAVVPPDLRSLQGAGVTRGELEQMLIVGGDAWVPLSPTSVLVEGTAHKGAVAKSFRWAFRQTIAYTDCKAVVNGAEVAGATLGEGDALVYDVLMAPERLLRDDVDEATAKLRFEPMAGADANGDGEVTLAELAKVPLESIRGIAPYGTGEAEGVMSLGDYVYRIQLPAVSRFRGDGTCVVKTGEDAEDND